MLRFSPTALLLSLALCGPAFARDVSGTLSYRERIALPPGAELLVVASSPFGTPAELRLTPEGQVPLPFTLTVEDTMPLTLRAAIFSGGAQLWVSEDIAVPEGEAAVDLGAIDLYRHVALGFSGTMQCGDRMVDVGFAGETLAIRTSGRVLELVPQESASGAKFGDADGNVFWSKGNRATVTLDKVDLPECVPVIAVTLPLVARGNEPGWVLTLTHEGVVYSGQDGTKWEMALPAATEDGGSTVFDSGDGFMIRVTDSLCRDTMTGMPYPYAVTLTNYADDTAPDLSGCAGDPRALLAGVWKLVDLPGVTLPEGAEATLQITGEFMSSAAGCNRFTGGVVLSGEGLGLTPGGMTMMACEEPLMQLEAAYMERLGRVGLFDIDEAGRLVLLVDGAPGAVFAR
jgi:heat shock protein HslJ